MMKYLKLYILILLFMETTGLLFLCRQFVKTYYHDWNRFTLITPADKSENVRFYTEKCGFAVQSAEMDGNVKVVRFVLER